MNNQPIGIFDSGVGGLSILEEINTILPKENIIYLADNKNCPYGNKNSSDILKLSIKNTSTLIQMNCKIIIIACNTATTNSIKKIRNLFSIPVIGIEPAIKPAILNTKTNKIGILATQKTLKSKVFNRTSNKFGNKVKIYEQIGYGLVDLIENGNLKETKNLLKTYLDTMLKSNIDQLVLGCTHYHFLIPIIKKIIPKTLNIQNPNEAIAKQTKKILKINNIQNLSGEKYKNIIYVNGKTEIIKKIIKSNGYVNTLDF